MAAQGKLFGLERSKKVLQLTKSVKKAYFCNVTGKGFANNKVFWNPVKPFLTNKGFLTNETISIENKGKIAIDKYQIANLFNTHYVNIVENMSGCLPT